MSRDIAIGRRGDQLTGECLTEEFVLETSFGTLRFAKKDIRRIELRGPNGLKHDEITTKRMDRSVGKLLNEVVEFRTPNGTTHLISRSALLALLLNWGFEESAASLI